jgi:hypothetical protein
MSVRRAQPLTLSVPAVDLTNRPARRSGVTFAASDCQVSKDGGAFANTSNLPIEIETSGRYALTLTADEMDTAWVHVKIEKEGIIDPVDLVLGTAGNPTGAVVSDAGNAANTFRTDLAESTNDHWKDCLLLFTSGALAGQVKKVTAYNSTTKFVTVSNPFTGTPAAGDRFVLINL